MINHYLSTTYEKGGRGPQAYDCWGLVREARVALFGASMLPVCAATAPGDLAAITRDVQDVSSAHGLALVPSARLGAIATAWRGKLCVHVGLVVKADGQLWVLETDEDTGPCLTRLPKFEERYSRVDYYAD